MAKESILIIEDNPSNMELASEVLGMAGFIVHKAYNAKQGINAARENLPDLVLMDIKLPGMDGLAAVRLLKQDPITRHIPVVALSAHAMRESEREAWEAGCCGYITKPFDIRRLASQVQDYMKAGGAE